MRNITDHKLSDLNQAITVAAMDEPGPGCANHHYCIQLNGDVIPDSQGTRQLLSHQEITFQKGAVKEVGLNGISDESLLAVLIDRLRGFQTGPFSCRQNAIAQTHLETALLWLQQRTRDRMARGVEGISKA